MSSNQSEYIGHLATDNARVVLAVTAAVYNPSDVGGYNLLAPILSFEYATKQGINGAIYTLMALDACNYESDMRDSLLSYIMSKYIPEIESLYSRNIINGKSSVSYDPYSSVTHAEFAAIITKSLGLNGGSSGFSDVSESDWFYDYVSAAYESGIINGISDTEFAPYKTITREEAVVMCARALKPPYMDTSERNALLTRFTDYLSLSNWAVDETAYCIKKNIIDNDRSALKPYENIKRDELHI